MADVEHDPRRHRFSVAMDGHNAELDYELSANVMTIYHTGVPAPIGGKGVAADLMRAAVKEATAHGWTIRPTCSYAAAYLKKHPIG